MRLRSIDVPLRMAGQRTPGHPPVVSSIFALTTRNPLVLSAAANSAAVIWGRRGAALRGFFIFNVFRSRSDYHIGAVSTPSRRLQAIQGRPVHPEGPGNVHDGLAGIQAPKGFAALMR